MNSLTRPFLITGFALLIGVTTAACSSGTESPAGDAGTPVPVKVAKVTMSDLTETFEVGGIVHATTTAAVTARVLAPVREVPVVPGDRVRAGQVLVVLDGRDLEARARSARAAATGAAQGATAAAAEQRAAEAALALARATHDRITMLHAKRSATAQELDEATAALRSAEARAAGAAARAQEAASGIESAQAASEAAGATESFTRITSPFDGVVTEKMVEPGNMAAPGLPLVRVEDTRGFRLEVHVDESRLGEIAAGASVPVSIDSAGGGATNLQGTVTEIARAVDADARAFLVKIALPGSTGLRSGSFGRARLAGAPRRALTLPATAIFRRGQVTSVFVVDNGIARLRLVNVRDTEVLAGLAEGETVIVDAPPDIVDGRRVSEGGR